MSGIFINYRSGPHSVAVAALAERLRHHFGPDQIFLDVQMTSGTRYPDELYRRLQDSDVLVAVIHDGWIDDLVRPRDKDWVRFEIATALQTAKPVVPVLLENVDPPQRDQLPDDIAEVAQRQAARVRSADFRADVDHLHWLLERYVAPTHVPPPEPRTAAKPKRVGRRVIAWAAALFLLAPILFFDLGSSDWEWFAFSAFASTVILASLSILSMTIFPAVKRMTRRWEDEAGTMSLREVMKRRWILPVVLMIPSAYFLSKAGPGDDGTWQEWEAWYVVVLIVVMLYFMHRMWRRYDARDYVWPPPVSTEPVVFRRAAHRLHEKLTTDPDWRGSRSRAIHREAVSVYLELAKTRLELRTMATMSLTRWIRTGRSGEITACLGWLASIVALDTVALAVLPRQESATAGAYRFIAITVAAALVLTAAKIVTEFYSDRRDLNRWIRDLTEWQARLGPLIFC